MERFEVYINESRSKPGYHTTWMSIYTEITYILNIFID